MCYFFIFQVERLKDQHKGEISRLYTDLEDESSSRSSMDRRLTELRREVQSTLIISKSKELSEIIPDIHTSMYQICRVEEKN